MKKYFFILLVFLTSTLCFAPGRGQWIWGIVGAQAEAAQVNASISSLEGLFKANPFGTKDNGLLQVMLDRANDLRNAMDALTAKVDEAMENLSQEDRQEVVYAYAEFLISIADLKKMADNRFLTDVSSSLGDTVHVCELTHFIWGNKYSLDLPQLPSI